MYVCAELWFAVEVIVVGTGDTDALGERGKDKARYQIRDRGPYMAHAWLFRIPGYRWCAGRLEM